MAFEVSIGDNAARVIATEIESDPQTGDRAIQLWEGPEDALKALVVGFRSQGAKSHAFPHEGPVWRARVRWPSPQDGGEELPVIKWSLETEGAQEDVWSSPNLLELAGNTDTLAEWKDDITSALKGGTNGGPKTPTATGFAGSQLAVYKLLMRGGRAFEFHRPVLRRFRSITEEWPTPIVVSARGVFYTTSRLISVFNVPNPTRSQLPTVGDFTPDDCAWGWKLRRQSSTFSQYTGKVEEYTDWVFAAWSALLYTLES